MGSSMESVKRFEEGNHESSHIGIHKEDPKGTQAALVHFLCNRDSTTDTLKQVLSCPLRGSLSTHNSTGELYPGEGGPPPAPWKILKMTSTRYSNEFEDY